MFVPEPSRTSCLTRFRTVEVKNWRRLRRFCVSWGEKLLLFRVAGRFCGLGSEPGREKVLLQPKHEACAPTPVLLTDMGRAAVCGPEPELLSVLMRPRTWSFLWQIGPEIWSRVLQEAFQGFLWGPNSNPNPAIALWPEQEEAEPSQILTFSTAEVLTAVWKNTLVKVKVL